MDYPNNTINPRKHKHLSFEERMTIQIRLKDGYSSYKIAKELGRASNTIRNEIARGTVTQIKHGHKVEVYLADAGENIYLQHRKYCCPKLKRLSCSDFISYVCTTMKSRNWSVDAIVNQLFKPSQMVCTKTLYNYIDLGLLEIRNVDLPMKFRRNTKPQRNRINRRILGTSIEERPVSIDSREEFGHWEIDTVIGTKDKNDSVLLTLAERKTRHYIVRKIASKTSHAVLTELANLKTYFGEQFNHVFKSITSDNGQEFAELSKVEQESAVKVYFTHPYASCERGTNERHNGLLRRFIPKGVAINGYSIDESAFIEEWCNTLPRKLLNYRTTEELFEDELDAIYAV
ncbi:IS30 family transposase [Cellulosilyticum sp. ST5]|uniref:IS30 family transposase n=1 Tax=Cellulosilyticum sp. ST5 TaxID=3055805 RepID=UPI003977CDC9